MEKGNILGRMVRVTKAIELKIKCKARGKLYGLMEENIMENILMIKNRDMESLFGRMVGGMKGNGWKGNRMGKELRF